MQIRDDPKKGLHDVRSFIGAFNLYRRHMHSFTYSSAPLTDLRNETNPWRWTNKEEACLPALKRKIPSTNCLGLREGVRACVAGIANRDDRSNSHL